jgi:hypothetical protein
MESEFAEVCNLDFSDLYRTSGLERHRRDGGNGE